MHAKGSQCILESVYIYGIQVLENVGESTGESRYDAWAALDLEYDSRWNHGRKGQRLKYENWARSLDGTWD